MPRPLNKQGVRHLNNTMNKKYYGVHTQKAIKNFPFSFRHTPKEFIYAIASIKRSSAIAHWKSGELDKHRKDAIVKATDEILVGKLDDQFFLPAFQGGAGTSNHMNVNEVIAGRATELLEKKKILVHPNDHVNMSESTNDVMPSALRIASFRLSKKLIATADVLSKELDKKAKEFRDVIKLGRTHMQDAVPVTLGGEFGAYAENVRRAKSKVVQASEFLLDLNLGGTAVGNSINASPAYIKDLYIELAKFTRLPFRQAKNLMAQGSSNSDLVWFAQSLSVFALEVSKIADDLRLLGSGPKGGFGEIILPELQAGSSIMPGKINPVLPEAANQVYFLVSGNALTIERAAAGAQLQLGVMLPVMVDRMIESLKLMDEMYQELATKCIAGLKADKKRCRETLEKSTAFATLLSPVLGYDATSSLVKEALRSGRTIRQEILRKKLLNNKQFDAIVSTFITRNLRK